MTWWSSQTSLAGVEPHLDSHMQPDDGLLLFLLKPGCNVVVQWIDVCFEAWIQGMVCFETLMSASIVLSCLKHEKCVEELKIEQVSNN